MDGHKNIWFFSEMKHAQSVDVNATRFNEWFTHANLLIRKANFFLGWASLTPKTAGPFSLSTPPLLPMQAFTRLLLATLSAKWPPPSEWFWATFLEAPTAPQWRPWPILISSCLGRRPRFSITLQWSLTRSKWVTLIPTSIGWIWRMIFDMSTTWLTTWDLPMGTSSVCWPATNSVGVFLLFHPELLWHHPVAPAKPSSTTHSKLSRYYPLKYSPLPYF